uniref:Unnmaed protein product n=2 Tax=Macaca TaxID=9539 RepID=Q9N040_MACFA|nr:unnmaed protein product [Macaca fascicularis]
MIGIVILGIRFPRHLLLPLNLWKANSLQLCEANICSPYCIGHSGICSSVSLGEETVGVTPHRYLGRLIKTTFQAPQAGAFRKASHAQLSLAVVCMLTADSLLREVSANQAQTDSNAYSSKVH